jgi:Flp pilus assembly protein TadD
MLGRHQDAQADYHKVMMTQPDSEAAADNLGVSLMLEGKFADAAVVLTPAANRPGSSPRSRADLAVALAAAGKGSQAGADLNAAGETTAIAEALQSRAGGHASGAAAGL